ncbi:GNAT family N-acetyltransferase [Microbacterium aoyamense]|uniref:GNAT family N-acetyltransferase n=1 Tax=Microbacterium aoyamense TaxID=344166 RepID=A0ABP5B388_9MICO|nr:GNAT family N-acetyltransferase [Microbacterium aoyamense]
MSEKSTADRIDAPAVVAPPQHPAVAIWRSATADDVELIMDLVQAADRIDHPSWLTPREDVEETFESSWIDPIRDTILGLDAEGRAVAMGGVMVHPSRDHHLHAYFTGRVHPELRGRGIGRELMRWEHERALQALAELDSPLPAAIFVYAEETDVAARHLAERRGLREERWFSTMVRDLALEIPTIEQTMDVGASAIDIVVYDSSRKEAARLARNDAFRDHWGSLETPPERWSQFVDGPFLRPDLSWLAVEDDRIVAFALGSVNEEDWAVQGYSSVYIDLIGVTRDRRGRRLAPVVITALLRAARAAGLEKAVLDVDTESPTGANSLYGRLGFEPTERSVALVAHH